MSACDLVLVLRCNFCLSSCGLSVKVACNIYTNATPPYIALISALPTPYQVLFGGRA